MFPTHDMLQENIFTRISERKKKHSLNENLPLIFDLFSTCSFTTKGNFLFHRK